MAFLTLVLIEFITLFFLAKLFTRSLSKLLFALTKSETVTIQILSFFFLPGVVIHELSHMLIAVALFVPTGEIEFFPKIVEHNVKLGSVAIGKTDPVRRAVIGLAPIIVGIAIFFVAAAFYSQSQYKVISLETLILFYLVFEVGNTMFSSTRDLEGLIETMLAGGVLAGGFYVFSLLTGINLSLTLPSLDFDQILSPLIMTFGIAILIDVLLIFLIKVTVKT